MNTTFSLYCFVLFIYFAIKLEGTARRYPFEVAPDYR